MALFQRMSIQQKICFCNATQYTNKTAHKKCTRQNWQQSQCTAFSIGATQYILLRFAPAPQGQRSFFTHIAYACIRAFRKKTH